MYYDIPNSPLAIRIWSGGLERYGQYFLDLFDVRSGISVNTPDDYTIVNVPIPGAFTFGGQLVSCETAYGVKRDELRPGAEKYSVPEGSRLAVIRRGQEPFYFQIPTRSIEGIAFAGPRPAIPLY